MFHFSSLLQWWIILPNYVFQNLFFIAVITIIIIGTFVTGNFWWSSSEITWYMFEYILLFQQSEPVYHHLMFKSNKAAQATIKSLIHYEGYLAIYRRYRVGSRQKYKWTLVLTLCVFICMCYMDFTSASFFEYLKF